MRKRKLPSVVTLLVLTVITVFVWIALDVYRAVTTDPAPVVPAEISEPLDPNLDTLSLETLSTRLFFDESEISTIVQTTPTPEPTVLPTTRPTLTPVATTTATIQPSPTPTP